jgi:nitronate monooxygenase
VRRLDWPAEYDERALGNSFLDRWHGNETQLLGSLPEAIDTYEKGFAADDFDTAAALVGEAVGLIDEVRPAVDIVRDVARDAAGILGRAARSVQG